jgi:transcriptional regulator with XRE-family HTH domain
MGYRLAKTQVNSRCEMLKSYSKCELARAAGVSNSTFQRWLRGQREHLSQWGINPRTQLLPPIAVRWICHQYGIDEEDLCRVTSCKNSF